MLANGDRPIEDCRRFFCAWCGSLVRDGLLEGCLWVACGLGYPMKRVACGWGTGCRAWGYRP